MRKCLAKYRIHNYIMTDYELQLRIYVNRLNKTFKDLQCQIHEGDSIIALCVDYDCEEYQHILCLKCIMNDHQNHTQNILVIQDLGIKREKLFLLLTYLNREQENNIELEWLRDSILEGKDLPYPTLTFENVFATVQDTFIQNIEDLKSQVEKSVHTINTQKYKKIQLFKQRMDDIIKTTQSQLYLNFQSVLNDSNELNELKSTNARSLPPAPTLNLTQIDQYTETQQQILDFTEEEQQQTIIEAPLPLMPTLSFVDATTKRSFFGKPKVKFTEGGKIITMAKNTIIVSQELYWQDNIEIRIRLQSFINGCAHFGIVEQTAYQLTKNIESVGYWTCLNATCEENQKLNKIQDFGLVIDNIVGLNLDFNQDLISLKLFTRDAVIVLYQKQGCLMKQKQYIYISCLEGEIKFEVLN